MMYTRYIDHYLYESPHTIYLDSLRTVLIGCMNLWMIPEVLDPPEVLYSHY
jgi:hypothetical protein